MSLLQNRTGQKDPANRRFVAKVLPPTLVFLTLALASCTDHVRNFEKARDLQNSGKCHLALWHYARLLEEAPTDEYEVISLIQLHMGECLCALNRQREAYMAFEESLRNNRNNTAAHLQLAELLLARGESAEALDHANIVLRSEPGNVEALSVIATELINSGREPQAEAILTHVLKIDPSHVNAAVTLAEVYAREGKPGMSRNVLHAVADLQPHDPKPWLALARLEEIAGTVEMAERCYRRALNAGDNDETQLRLAEFLARQAQIKQAEDVLRGLGARHGDALLELPDFELAAGRSKRAVALYAPMLRAPAPVSGSVVGGPHGSVAARLIEAELQLAYQQRRGEDSGFNATVGIAKADFARFGRSLDPAVAATIAAEISLVQDDVSSAEQHAQQAIARAPNSAAGHYVLGAVQKRAGLPNVAKSEWQTALQLAPGFVPARLALASAALEAADPAAAAELASAVVREQPANFVALCIYARALTALGHLEEAGLIAHRALVADPSSAEAHEILGAIAVRQSNLGTALVEYEQALMVEPHSQPAIRELADVYRKGKVQRSMLAKIEKTASSPPKSAALMEIAGRLYADHAWQADARRCLRLALLWDPERTSAATMLAQLYLSSGHRAAAEELLSRNSTARADAGKTVAEVNVQANYERVLREGDPTGAAANNLAWNYAQQGIKLDRALELAQQARLLAPRNPAVLDTLGVVHLKRREYTKAVQTLEKAMALAVVVSVSEDTMLQFRQHLAEAYLRSGQTRVALELQK